jgi:hypothetical protein
MKVFISHKSDDIELAEKHARRLTQLGFDFYLDKFDPVISGVADRALHIQNEIQLCSDLLVVITSITHDSWWVPFEIGLSTVFDIRIASVVYDSPALPSFIRKWPLIDTKQKYQEYLRQLKLSRRQLITEGVYFSKSFESAIPPDRISEAFHKNLMHAFGQK